MKTIVPLPMKDDKMVKDPIEQLKKGKKKTVMSKSGGWIKDAAKNKKSLSSNSPRNNKRK